MQNKPNLLECSNERNLCFNKELQKFSSQPTPRKQTQFKANWLDAQNERNLCFNKPLRKLVP